MMVLKTLQSLIGIISLEGETEKDVDKYMQEHKVQIVDHNQETKEEIKIGLLYQIT